MATVNITANSRKVKRRDKRIRYGRVVDIILDPNHPQWYSWDDMGTIFFVENDGALSQIYLIILYIMLNLYTLI